MNAKKTEPDAMPPATKAAFDSLFAEVKPEVESMSDSKLYAMLFLVIRESVGRRDRNSVIKQLRGQADCLERERAQAAH